MEAIIGTALTLAVVNAAVTVFVTRAPSMLGRQKLAQCLLLWLAPVFGAIVVSIFLYTNRETSRGETRNVRNEEDYPGVNLYPPHGPSDS